MSKHSGSLHHKKKLNSLMQHTQPTTTERAKSTAAMGWGGDGEIYRRGRRTTGGFGLRGPLSDAGPRSPMINWRATLASPRGGGGRGSCHLSRGGWVRGRDGGERSRRFGGGSLGGDFIDRQRPHRRGGLLGSFHLSSCSLGSFIAPSLSEVRQVLVNCMLPCT
jgi:hypothetical protein